ncbi:UNVERIFIED_ORG: hypothetical protein J2Y78_004908 [Buttiauxella agrestis ATCC 33320]
MKNWYFTGLGEYRSEVEVTSDVITLSWGPVNTGYYALSTQACTKNILYVGCFPFL